jgi:DNA-binding MarR family transcriptional regulator
MPGRLAHEIKQSKAFPSLAEEAALNLQRTAAVLEQAFESALRPHGISATQHNALRILRGAGPKGLPCQEVGARMVRLDPDLTRLFDRLEARGLIARARSSEDRRVIMVRIAPTGTKLLSSLDAEVEGFLASHLGRMSEKRLAALIELCEEARGYF